MTPRTRQLFVAAAAVLAIPAGLAVATHRPAEEAVAETAPVVVTTSSSAIASSTSTSTSTTTTEPVAPETTTTTAAPAPPTTVDPLAGMTDEQKAAFAAFVSAPPTTATPPTTAAPAPRRVVVTAPPVTNPPPPPPPPTVPDAAYFAVGLTPPTPPTTAPAPAPEPAAEPAPDAPADPGTGSPLDSLSPSDQAFLACVRWRESRNDYTAVNRSSGAGGAYQFLQTTWNNTAIHLGRGDLVGLRPNYAAPADQDAIAVHLLQWYGRSPWGYVCY